MKPKLSILIPTTPDRAVMLATLKADIERQINLRPAGEVELLICHDNYERTVGDKRNELLQHASGDYVAFIDDDDDIHEFYIDLLMEGIDKGVDCCSLRGKLTENGQSPELFEHSIRHDRYDTLDIVDMDDIKYIRFPNHLNTIKSTIAKQFRFPSQNISEDTEFANQIHDSGLIKTEHYIPEVIYFYKHNSNDSVQTKAKRS